MRKLNKLLLLTLTALGFMAPFGNKFVQTKADSLIRQKISYNEHDYAYLQVYNPNDQYLKKYFVFGFDSVDENIDEINRMGFRISYRVAETIGDKISHWWNELWNNPQTKGTLIQKEEMVKATTKHSFEYNPLNNGPLGPGLDNYYNEPEKLQFKAVGKMSDLFAAEAAATDFTNDFKLATHSNHNYIELHTPYGLGWTGGYSYKITKNTRLNDASQSMAARKFYAIIPIPYVEEIAPESIDCFLFDGTHVSDGLDEDGNAYTDEFGNKYIEIRVGRDFGAAINGNNAKVTKIVASGYSNENNTIISVKNGNWNYTTYEPASIANIYRLASNETKELNWHIANNNRYLFIDYTDDQLAQEVTLKVFYESTSNAWLLNVTDKDGNFLPAPIRPDPKRGSSGINIEWKDLLIILGIVITLIIILVVLYDMFKAALLGR